MDENYVSFESFFSAGTGLTPYPYQVKLASDEIQSRLIHVPTGCGKTAAVILAWLWQRRRDPDSTPRRLIYCLPMRVLVEQTRDNTEKWLRNLNLREKVGVHLLLGGEQRDDWDLYPEREAILIGTQDMLLSRALNRGYAMSRYRWPVHFGLLNNDCLWVCDEVQLMGSGLGTTTQLQSFREQMGALGPVVTWWISATLRRGWLETADFQQKLTDLPLSSLTQTDFAHRHLARIVHAKKILHPAPKACRTPEGLAAFVKDNHISGTQTLVVVNQVERAQETFDALNSLYRPQPTGKRLSVSSKRGPGADVPEIHLLHSRFRPHERQGWQALLEREPTDTGRIIVSTQVIEAGVDLSSSLLVTDLAPLSSLLQRFGRCNRRGESNEARVFWVDRPLTGRQSKLAKAEHLESKDQDEVALPYTWQEIEAADRVLGGLDSAGPADLPELDEGGAMSWVLRRRDVIDLFDTTSDLSGYDLDISRFVREGEERDVFVAWRELNHTEPTAYTGAPNRDELCPVPIWRFKEVLEGALGTRTPRIAWTWNALDSVWDRVGSHDTGRLRPGMVLLMNAADGAYDVQRGFDPRFDAPVPPVPSAEGIQPEEGMDNDPLSATSYFQALLAHSREVEAQTSQLLHSLENLGLDDARDDLKIAALYHDLGKAHPVFQTTLRTQLPQGADTGLLVAKSLALGRHERPHFRHELASALALLKMGSSDLAVYLAACHHGKVRLSIRALPGESKPNTVGAKFARGVQDGDVLPSIDFGVGRQTTEIALDLEPMLLGRNSNGQPSWLERMLALRDMLGPFRLAFFEALIRSADGRASAAPKETL
jgi:CRISPR-associated endonuclease/helicase Cas3